MCEGESKGVREGEGVDQEDRGEIEGGFVGEDENESAD